MLAKTQNAVGRKKKTRNKWLIGITPYSKGYHKFIVLSSGDEPDALLRFAFRILRAWDRLQERNVLRRIAEVFLGLNITRTCLREA